MARVTSLWRYPIKSHGREKLQETRLEAGKTLPFDRVWAVAHTESDADGSDWAPCANFSRVSKAPELMAIQARYDVVSGKITLTHPNRDPLTFDPDQEPQALIDWAGPMIPENRAQSARVVRGETQGFTDSPFPSVTLCSMASHRSVETHLGREISIARWRGNIWFDGFFPWTEFDWMNKEVQIGDAILVPRERTDRCLATHNNPDTGKRDIEVLNALKSWGHQDFSIRAEVVKSGRVGVGDTIRVL